MTLDGKAVGKLRDFVRMLGKSARKLKVQGNAYEHAMYTARKYHPEASGAIEVLMKEYLVSMDPVHGPDAELARFDDFLEKFLQRLPEFLADSRGLEEFLREWKTRDPLG